MFLHMWKLKLCGDKGFPDGHGGLKQCGPVWIRSTWTPAPWTSWEGRDDHGRKGATQTREQPHHSHISQLLAHIPLQIISNAGTSFAIRPFGAYRCFSACIIPFANNNTLPFYTAFNFSALITHILSPPLTVCKAGTSLVNTETSLRPLEVTRVHFKASCSI